MIGWMREIKWTAICIKKSTVLDKAVTLNWFFLCKRQLEGYACSSREKTLILESRDPASFS